MYALPVEVMAVLKNQSGALHVTARVSRLTLVVGRQHAESVKPQVTPKNG